MHYIGHMGSRTVPGWAMVNATPAKVARLRTTEEASAALRFAAEHNLAVSVKGTGHDWFGRSTGAGTLLLWTHEMKNIAWHDNFTPVGCQQPIGEAVSLGAGVQFWELYDEQNTRGRMGIGGDCSTVGHVGFTLGGGYGDYSRMFGSGATNAVEAEVVLANGSVVVASACSAEHAELFWALRGGGAGYGLISRITYRTHPKPEHGRFGRVKKQGGLSGPHGIESFLAWYRERVIEGHAKHFGGHLNFDRHGSISVDFLYSGLSLERCSDMVSALNATCEPGDDLWKRGDVRRSLHGVEGWFPAWENGLGYILSSNSRYFKLEHITGRNLTHFVRGLRRLVRHVRGMQISLNYVLGRGSDVALRHAKQTSVHPDVYEAIGTLRLLQGHWHRDWQSAFLPTARTPVDELHADAAASVRRELDLLLPGAGAYFNEGDIAEPHWQERYWGANYAGLLRTKQLYDPRGMFSCHQCVGSESRLDCERRLGSVWV